MSLRRTFQSEIAPGIHLCTDAVAVIDYHDDGKPCVSVEYRSHRLKHENGVRCKEELWPPLRTYMRNVKFGHADPHRTEVDSWSAAIYEQIEAQRTEGTEAPMFSHGRDNRPSTPPPPRDHLEGWLDPNATHDPR